VLRATGLTPGQLWGLVSLQTGLLGLLAGLFSVPLGVALAYVLVHVINQRSFGWTLQLAVTPATLVQAVVLALVASALAGLYPAWKMARANPALALREE
jgi:putative ABC transport system permease protein